MTNSSNKKAAAAIDFETDGLHKRCTVFCVTATRASGSETRQWNDDTKKWLQDILLTHELIFHNASFDVRVARENGLEVPSGFWDTMIMSYVWNPRRESHSLESWGIELGYPKIDYRAALIEAGLLDAKAPKGAEYLVPWNHVMDKYCTRDGQITYRLFGHLIKKFKTDPKAFDLLVNVELPFIEAIMEMEGTGWFINVEKSRSTVDRLTKGIDRIIWKCRQVYPWGKREEVIYKRREQLLGDTKKEMVKFLVGTTPVQQSNRIVQKKIYEERPSYIFVSESDSTTGYTTVNGDRVYDHCKLEPFNPNSDLQVREALSHLYNWEPEKFTRTGLPQVSAEVLEGLDFRLCRLLVVLSDLVKAREMIVGYLDRLQNHNRLYGHFNQAVTKTGRLSSTDPN